MHVIRRDSLRATPWKNGGGETREIACFPPGSLLTDFEWRLSTASIAQDGAFSIFDGIDRRLYLLEGNGLDLRFDPGPNCTLGVGEHVDFRGEIPVHGSLVDGPVVDLNIMVRREKQRAHIEEQNIAGSATLKLPWKTAAIFVGYGQLNIAVGSSKLIAGTYDTIMLVDDHAPEVSVAGNARIILIGFERP